MYSQHQLQNEHSLRKKYLGKGKGTRYLTSEVPLLSYRVLSQETDDARILPPPPSSHQCSVLKLLLSYTEWKEVETRM